jgi:DNA-binding CsgD family transcriptional regulator/PAS domain-containing protein
VRDVILGRRSFDIDPVGVGHWRTFKERLRITRADGDEVAAHSWPYLSVVAGYRGKGMRELPPERVSTLIGMIYDCAVDPDHWQQTLAEICGAMQCMSGAMMLLDLEHSRHKFAYTCGLSSEWAKRFLEHSDDLTLFYRRAFSREMCLDGEPLLVSRLFEQTGPRGRRVYEDWTQPQGISEMVQTVVLRQARRLAVLGANRHRSVGPLTDEEMGFVRMLVPHLRRALTITDILDTKKLEVNTLAATLDQFSAGILVVADRGRILHANDTAREMLSKREPIVSTKGILSVRDRRADRELANAIALAQADEAAIGANGIGVPLRDEGSAVAHVLPLARGELRTRLTPQAAAAVFITRPDDAVPEDISAVAAGFGLTPAESRVLGHMASGATLAEAAYSLGVSGTTARTHLYRIFSKTGVSRQSELIALVIRMMPSTRRSRKN